jgi:hypothetical protein
MCIHAGKHAHVDVQARATRMHVARQNLTGKQIRREASSLSSARSPTTKSGRKNLKDDPLSRILYEHAH